MKKELTLEEVLELCKNEPLLPKEMPAESKTPEGIKVGNNEYSLDGWAVNKMGAFLVFRNATGVQCDMSMTSIPLSNIITYYAIGRCGNGNQLFSIHVRR